MTVEVSIDDGIATVVMNRPPVNALNSAMWKEIADAFRGLIDNEGLRVVILTGAGEKAFSAGNDLKESPSDRNKRPENLVVDAYMAIFDCPVPVIAAVQGPAIAGGACLAAMCDIVIAEQEATFAWTGIDVGLWGASIWARRFVPAQFARWMAYTGSRVLAADLVQLGTVLRVVPREDFAESVQSLAMEIAGKDPSGVRTTKSIHNHLDSHALSFTDAVRNEVLMGSSKRRESQTD